MPAHHVCPVAGCDAQVVHGRLLCLRHWRRVPRPIQRRVWRWWRKLRCGELRARRLHDAACEAAIRAASR